MEARQRSLTTVTVNHLPDDIHIYSTVYRVYLRILVPHDPSLLFSFGMSPLKRSEARPAEDGKSLPRLPSAASASDAASRAASAVGEPRAEGGDGRFWLWSFWWSFWPLFSADFFGGLLSNSLRLN